MPLNWPDISQNQLFQASLGLLGAGTDRRTNPFQAAQQGLVYGSQLDKNAKEEARLEEEAARRKRLEDAWGGLFGVPSAPGAPDVAGGGGSGIVGGDAMPMPDYSKPYGGLEFGLGMPQGSDVLASGPASDALGQIAGQNMGPIGGRKSLPPLGTEVVGRTPEGRPMIANSDGSYSTERSITVQTPDGRWVNIPSMFGGKQVSEDEAVSIMQRNGWKDPETGRPAQFFGSVREAEAAAQARSNSIPSMGGPQMPYGAPAASPGAPQGNPLLAGLPPGMAPLLSALPPEQGIPFLLDRMNQKPTERRIVQGADGYNYYADTGERVLPGVEAKPEKPPTGYRYGEDGNLQVDPNWLATQIQLKQAGRPQTNVNVDTIGKTLSPGQKKIDETYAADYADFVLGGGYADSVRNLEQIGDVIQVLKQPGSLTGGISARLPDWARATIDPEGLNVQQLTEEVIQRNLREVLGPQFTEKEGDRLIARAYDPRLDDDKNIARLERLYGAMMEGLEARKEAAEYFEENETMKGYKGAKRVTIRDLEKALEEPEDQGSGMDFSAMSPQDLLAVDATKLNTKELDALMKAMDDAGL